ncbi:MAG: GC-type dockerin domain-anchored protein [Phycisphaerales bacterium]
MHKPIALCALFAASSLAHAQLRVGIWNITHYDGEPELDGVFRTALFDEFDGRSFRPDVLLIQEINAAAATRHFLDVLNSDPRGGQDWARAAFFDGPRITDTALYYRTSKIRSATGIIASAAKASPGHPRHLARYTLELEGYSDATTHLVVYNTHMQAGSTALDEQRRLDEGIEFREDAQSLPEGTHFLIGGDLNVKRSTEPVYIEITEDRANNHGRVFDPIATPGEWVNNPAFVFVHTQDPFTQMDDRMDQILVCDDLIDGQGLDYLGDWTTPFSTRTFDDPNHSYRTWGNDGTSFNQIIRRRGNRMVGEAIASALFDSCGGESGHLPVYCDLLLPASVTSAPRLNFGRVAIGTELQVSLTVSHAGDVDRWQRNDTIAAPPGGLQPLRYTLVGDGPIGVPAGEFTEDAGGAGNGHAISIDTSSIGRFEATVRIESNDPDEPVRSVRVVGEIVACAADLDGDGGLTVFDLLAFQNLFDAGDLAADFDGDGELTLFDFLAFQSAFNAGC